MEGKVNNEGDSRYCYASSEKAQERNAASDGYAQSEAFKTATLHEKILNRLD